MRVRMETVKTVYFDMPVEEAESILEALNQHLMDKSPEDFPPDDLIHPVFEFRDRLRRIIGGR